MVNKVVRATGRVDNAATSDPASDLLYHHMIAVFILRP
jgi:hypothetical protein